MPKEQPPQSELDGIASRLKRSRLALKISQVELCRATGIATNTYNQWEAAQWRPEISQAKKLRKHLGYTLDWIYDGDPKGLSFELRVALGDIPEQQASEAQPRQRLATGKRRVK